MFVVLFFFSASIVRIFSFIFQVSSNIARGIKSADYIFLSHFPD